MVKHFTTTFFIVESKEGKKILPWKSTGRFDGSICLVIEHQHLK